MKNNILIIIPTYNEQETIGECLSNIIEESKKFDSEIIVVDAKEERIRKRMKSNFTSVLIDLMRKAIDKKEQVILFQNLCNRQLPS